VTPDRRSEYILHCSTDKEYLIDVIRRRGSDVERQVEAVRSFPTTESIPAKECVDYDTRGLCNGHPVDPSKRPAHLLPADPDFPTSIREGAP
jgi:hypothetical protein